MLPHVVNCRACTPEWLIHIPLRTMRYVHQHSMSVYTNHLHFQVHYYCIIDTLLITRGAAYLQVSRFGCHHCGHCVNGAWRLLAQQPPQHCNVPTSSSCTGKQPDDQQHTFSYMCSASAAGGL
jgi:hypothetical protein